MTMLAHNPRVALASRRLDVNDRVSVPNGRTGRVIGFYHRADETVLVRFDFGDSREYAPAELHRLG